MVHVDSKATSLCRWYTFSYIGILATINFSRGIYVSIVALQKNTQKIFTSLWPLGKIERWNSEIRSRLIISFNNHYIWVGFHSRFFLPSTSWPLPLFPLESIMKVIEEDIFVALLFFSFKWMGFSYCITICLTVKLWPSSHGSQFVLVRGMNFDMWFATL